MPTTSSSTKPKANTSKAAKSSKKEPSGAQGPVIAPAPPAFDPFTAGLSFMQQFGEAMGQNALTMTQPLGLPEWAMPSLNPAEIEKRIQELKTVLFWLEQNATALKATVQALEVQKMTLQTLQAMTQKPAAS